MKDLVRRPRAARGLPLLCGLLALGFGLFSRAARVSADSLRQTETPPALPASSTLDFSATLDAPAGRHGFVTVGDDGRFHFADGGRARFWGVNVSSTRLNLPPDQIERVVANFARAGLNLVRLEAIDNRNCLLGSVDAPDSLHFDARYLDRLDHWMDALRRHGLYYYLDLLDFRTFKSGDGVLNAEKLDRGARPYALFDRYLIQLQKDYAARLLTRRNPYSGLRPVDDPALALVEICNEHGFFLYPDKLEALGEPYRTDLRARWNAWLRDRYPTRDALALAWGQANGQPVLNPGEDPSQITVALPTLTRTSVPVVGANAPVDSAPDQRRAPARLRDGVQFLSEMQRAYFREMRAYLRGLGLKTPITGVVSNDMVPDISSVAQECDFTSENWYADGATDDPRAPGARYYANRDPLRDDGAGGFAPFTAALRWNNQPVVIREWANPWPNRWRAASIPEALAYAALQDYDAILLFGYQTNRAPNGAEADALNDFAFQSDPTVWGLTALAGRAFLSGAIRPAAHTLTLAYPPARQFQWPNGVSDLHRMAWSVRLNSRLVTDAEVARQAKEKSQDWLTPTNGPQDVRRVRALLDDLAREGVGMSSRSMAAGVWRSDTGEIARYTRDERLEIQTPTLRLIAGQFAPGRVYALGGLRFTTPTQFGALLALALDGKPLERSGHVVVKMVSRAENTGQSLVRAASGAINEWLLKKPGAAPVLTFGQPVATPTRLWLTTPARRDRPNAPANDAPLLTLWLKDGTWELDIRDGRATLTCDTPAIRGLANGETAFTTGEGATEMTASAEAKSPLPAR